MQDTGLRKKVGQLFAVGFHGLTPSPEIKSLIHDYRIGGIVLFKRNIRDAQQLQSLILALQDEARIAGHEHPLFIGIDQENGLVTRICPPVATQLPGPMALGATHSPDLAYEVGRATGECLNYFGINMNYAPVCDINSEPLNPVIGVRSPGDDPELVGQFASAAAHGLRKQRIIPSSKHFPGHGETAVDSHYGLPVIPKTRDQLERCELVPFRRTVAEGVESVMTAHIALPAIGDGKLPATLSADALNILRKDMKYDGMIVTDCLEMNGIRATYGTEQGSVLALNAGSDSVMICHTHAVQMASIDRVCQAVQSGGMSLSRLDEAHRRVTRLKRTFLNWDTALHSNPVADLTSFNQQSAVLAKEAYSRSATLVRCKPDVVPLSKSSKIVFLFPGANTPAGGAVDGEGLGRQGSYDATIYGDVIRRHNQFVIEVRYGPSGLSAEQWSLVESADVVILTTVNARESPYQENLGLELPNRARSLVAIAACNPYDFLEHQSIETYVVTYEPTIDAFEAAADVIFGASSGKGKLPVGPGKSAQPQAKVTPFDAGDVEKLATIWNAALPTYHMSTERLRILVVRERAHHFVARVDSTLVGFCLAYTTENQGKTSGQIAALAVDHKYQGQGIGTALLTETRAYFRNQFGLNNLALGSAFPRFWPGIPRDLPDKIQDFFVHRGFRLNPPGDRSVDLYQEIKDFQAPEKYITRAKERGYTFSPLQDEHHEACMAAQKKNFPTYTGWIEAYEALDPRKYPDSVMVAFDSEGKQVGWTLMLPPSSPILDQRWAMPLLCGGPKTGLIGCVGVDKDCRKAGIGRALVCHAMESMKQRGDEGVFVDWVSMDGWYEQVGFEVWRSYRTGEI